MSNSSLVSYTKISPNRTSPRKHEIDTITIHCVVGQLDVETIGDIFAPKSREASSNYGIGKDGKIGMYVEEKDRSWCSGNRDNDHRAVTIECACEKTSPYAINSKVYKSLVELCADICRRNNIKKLIWKGDKSLIGKPEKQNMTVHRWFQNTDCPGDYIYNNLGKIAEDVNAKLAVKPLETIEPASKVEMVKMYRVRLTWDNSKSQKGAYKVLENAKKCADANPGYSVYDDNGKVVYTSKKAFEPYMVRVAISNLNIRTGPGTSYKTTGKFTGKGSFTIVEESKGAGSTAGWGRLKSGAGWISLDYATKI